MANAIAGKKLSSAKCQRPSRIRSNTATPAGIDRPINNRARSLGSKTDNQNSYENIYDTLQMNFFQLR